MSASNAAIKFIAAYFPPGANMNAAPEVIGLEIASRSPNSWKGETFLPPQKLTIQKLREDFPFLDMGMSDKAANRFLRQQLAEALETKEVPLGYYLQEQGAVEFPDGSLRFLHGDTLYPDCSCPYIAAPENGNMALVGKGSTSMQDIRMMLCAAPPQALLTIAFVVLTSIRSLILRERIPLQAVLYIVGGQGLGKTTLATRLAGIYRDFSSDPPHANIVQAGSTMAAVETMLVTHRDQPVIVDDLCLSAGKETERRRRELGAKLVRAGAGDIPIVKKSGKKITQLQCKAGVILTAEFPLENLSDLTRCVIVPVNQRLHLSPLLTPELIGDMLRHYSRWFAANRSQELKRLQENLNGDWGQDLEPRIRTNYGCLRWAFQSLIAALTPESLVSADKTLSKKIEQALDIALDAHMEMMQKLRERMPLGNLSAIIYSGYKNGGFNLAEKINKLRRHDGIYWKGDLCLRKEALVRFIRFQPGYHDWTCSRIIQSLKDIGALVLQEDSVNTVHLAKGVPRVYRIRLDIIKDTAEYRHN